jgi:lysophospholipase L1-like esterase
MVGVNDFWTVPVEPAGRAPDSGGWLRRHSRVYKLAFMAWHQIVGPVAADSASAPHRDDAGARQLGRNLDRIADLVQQHDAQLVVLTYPYGTLQSHCNVILREFARRRGLLLVDTAAHYEELCGTRHCEELLFFDNHPSAAGQEMIARLLADALRRSVASGALL